MIHTEYIILEANFVGSFIGGSPEVIEIGAIRVQKGNVINKFETIVNVDCKYPSDYQDHGLDLIEVQVAPTWAKIVPEVLDFCSGAKLTGWLGYVTMHVVQLAIKQTKQAEGWYWLHDLDLRSYLIGKGIELSRSFRKVCEKNDLKWDQRPVVRCQRLFQLMEMFQENTQQKGEEGKYEVYEV